MNTYKLGRCRVLSSPRIRAREAILQPRTYGEETMERVINTIGKRCLVNCFEKAWLNQGELTNADIVACDPDVGRSENGLSTRRSNIKRLFDEGLLGVALLACINATRIPSHVRGKARQLYDKYCQR